MTKDNAQLANCETKDNAKVPIPAVTVVVQIPYDAENVPMLQRRLLKMDQAFAALDETYRLLRSRAKYMEDKPWPPGELYQEFIAILNGRDLDPIED